MHGVRSSHRGGKIVTKTFVFLAALVVASAASISQAQQPRVPLRGQKSSLKVRADKDQPPAPISLSDMTPEMWLYLQEQRRYDDPRMAVRRKAEFRADQRRRRIAAREWFGLSNKRPTANPTPWYGAYSPYWGSNDVMRPYQWTASGRLPVYGVRSSATGIW